MLIAITSQLSRMVYLVGWWLVALHYSSLFIIHRYSSLYIINSYSSLYNVHSSLIIVIIHNLSVFTRYSLMFIVIHRYSSVYIVIYCYPSLVIVIHHYSSIFIVIHHYSLLFVVIHRYYCCPSLFIVHLFIYVHRTFYIKNHMIWNRFFIERNTKHGTKEGR